jgi:hypothetical protein
MQLRAAASIPPLDAPLIASLEDEMNKLIIVSAIATVIAANLLEENSEVLRLISGNFFGEDKFYE